MNRSNFRSKRNRRREQKKKNGAFCFISYECLNALWKKPFEAIVSLIRLISHTLSTSPFHSPPTIHINLFAKKKDKKKLKGSIVFGFNASRRFQLTSDVRNVKIWIHAKRFTWPSFKLWLLNCAWKKWTVLKGQPANFEIISMSRLRSLTQQPYTYLLCMLCAMHWIKLSMWILIENFKEKKKRRKRRQNYL